MYVAFVPNRKSPPAILLRESYREGSKIRSRTLANLTHWKPERVEALQRALKGEFDGLDGDPTRGEIFAVLLALNQLADQVALSRILGDTTPGRLALFLFWPAWPMAVHAYPPCAGPSSRRSKRS